MSEERDRKCAVKIERHGAAATLRLDREHANAINETLVEDLSLALDELRDDGQVRGVILASAHPRVFCPGLDLRELSGYDRPRLEAFMRRFSDCYRALFTFPGPVVAAVAGHAVAGGCVLALCADHRVLQEDAMIGLNEVRLGVTLPWGVAVIVRHEVVSPKIVEAVMLGRNFRGSGAVEAGLAHEVAPAGQVERAAREKLEEFMEKEPEALADMKTSLRSEAERSIREGDAVHAARFLDIWFSEPTQTRIREVVRGLEGGRR